MARRAISRNTADLSTLPPIYPVVAGERAPKRDLAISETSVSQIAFEDAPVTVDAIVTARDFRGEAVAGDFSKVTPDAPADAPKPEAAAEMTLTPAQDEERLVFRMQPGPRKPACSFYRFEAASAVAKPPPRPRWPTTSTFLHVDRGSGAAPHPLRRRAAQLGIQIPSARGPGR